MKSNMLWSGYCCRLKYLPAGMFCLSASHCWPKELSSQKNLRSVPLLLDIWRTALVLAELNCQMKCLFKTPSQMDIVPWCYKWDGRGFRGTNGYPIPDPNPKYFSIPDPYPIYFQNHRVFRVSGIRENQVFDMNPCALV